MSATYATTIISSATLAATTAALSRHSRHLGRHCQTGHLPSEVQIETRVSKQELQAHFKKITRTTYTPKMDNENENENENENANESYYALEMVVSDFGNGRTRLCFGNGRARLCFGNGRVRLWEWSCPTLLLLPCQILLYVFVIRVCVHSPYYTLVRP